MPSRYICIDCGVRCGRNRPKTDTRCRACWIKWKKHHPECEANWRGGRVKIKSGYIYVKSNGHPNAMRNGYIMEQRLVMSNYLGRPLTNGEIVHHKNGNKSDNRLENLQLTNKRDHYFLHPRFLPMGHPKRTTVCRICGKPERCKGLCKSHYARKVLMKPCETCGKPTWKNYKFGRNICWKCFLKNDKVRGKCTLCERPHAARGFCKLHYKHWMLGKIIG